MNCKDFQEVLNDFIDGLLSPEEKQKVETHLEACPVCREELERFRSLIAEARALPKSVSPARDLWPDILDRLEGGEEEISAEEKADSRAWWSRYGFLAAAAVLIAIITVFLATSFFMEREDPSLQFAEDGSIQVLPAATAPEDIVLAEAEYLTASEKLLQVLNERGDSLSPKTLAVVRQNIGLIDSAIGEIKGALEKDPANPQLNQLLLATYQRQLKLLKRATALPPRKPGRGTGFILRDSSNRL